MVALALRTPIQEMRATLAERFPACFMPKGADKRPLAIGIINQILAAAPDLDVHLVHCALNDYVNGRKYQTQLFPDAPRYNLDGSVASTVTLEGAAYAVHTMKRLEKRWNRWQTQRKPKAVAS